MAFNRDAAPEAGFQPEAVKVAAPPASLIKATRAVRLRGAQALLLSTEAIAIVFGCESGGAVVEKLVRFGIMGCPGKFIFPGAVISPRAGCRFFIEAFADHSNQLLGHIGLLQKIQTFLDDKILSYNVGAVTTGENSF